MASPPVRVRWTVFVILALLGLAIRLPRLGDRPMHTDEAVNAYIMGQMLRGQPFEYDSQDRHGPALAALTLPMLKLEGARDFAGLTEAGLRLSPVLAGTATVLLFAEGVEMFGFVTCCVAALILVLAPLPVYYNRYFIHESWFVAATWAAILAAWHAVHRQSVSAGAVTGFFAALMLACKETAPLHFCSLALGGVIWWLISPRRESLVTWPPRIVVYAGLAAFLFTTILLFTWFGHNFGVFRDLVRAIPHLVARAGGEGHEKSWWYYVKLLAGGWSGGVLLALTLAGAYRVLLVTRHGGTTGGDRLTVDGGWARATALPTILAVYGLGIFVTYSLIPYKTPWLALNFWLPMALLCGSAVEWGWLAVIKLRARAGLVLLIMALGGLMAHDTFRRVFVSPADAANPYAYAHTVDDLLGLPIRIAELAHRESLADPRIAVVAADPWPLPWYLRRFSQVGFWQPGDAPGPADFFVTSPEAAEKMSPWLTHYRPEYFGLRPEVLLILWTPETSGKTP